MIDHDAKVPCVIGVQQVGPYRLRLRFEDGAVGELDIKAYMPFRGVFANLKDPDYFAQVCVDQEAGTIVWPNGADLDPCSLRERITVLSPEADASESDWATLPARHVPSAGESISPQPLQAGGDVPEISRFYGIVVSMYFSDHARPHFHARYGGAAVVIEISSLRVTQGHFPANGLALLRAWASKHQGELLEDWDLARSGKPLKKIAPLE